MSRAGCSGPAGRRRSARGRAEAFVRGREAPREGGGFRLLACDQQELQLAHDRKALVEARSSMLALGFAGSNREGLNAIDFCAAATGPVTIGLQVGYLPATHRRNCWTGSASCSATGSGGALR
ncbi:hypothetical protein [Streptomyces sp. NPDC049949]|uniref:hypothetical protein n=1 Tax=Streptomyces sp. NPDC049949 TaxID=3154627 RepID=UPI003446D235